MAERGPCKWLKPKRERVWIGYCVWPVPEVPRNPLSLNLFYAAKALRDYLKVGEIDLKQIDCDRCPCWTPKDPSGEGTNG
jgi:hypothetical protein